MINAFHNPYDPAFRCPLGALKAGERTLLRLTAGGAARATLRLWRQDHEELIPMRRVEDNLFEAFCPAGNSAGLLWYYFICEEPGGARVRVGKPVGGICECRMDEPASFQITVYDPAFETPSWMRGSVMMQIFPDRFAIGRKIFPPTGRGNYLHSSWNEAPHVNPDPNDIEGIDFFGGNLFGIAEKMPYIADMGIKALYLNPIFRARSNHKYDTGDYMHVDPCFGGDEALEELLKAAAQADIRVVTDGVFSHTGADSVYFNKFNTYPSRGAYNSYENSPYSGWYRFGGSRDEYECWWDFDTLPDVEELSPSFMDFIIRAPDSVLAHYLNKGTAGWRLDVADELPMDFIRAVRRRVKEVNPDACVIGEVWEDITNKVAYGETRCYSAGDTLDSAMNYPLRTHLIDFLLGRESAYALSEFLNHQLSTLPRPQYYSMMNLLGSHDRPRIISVLSGRDGLEPPRLERHAQTLSRGEYELGKSRFLRAFEFICRLPGMPCLYYGDDMGLTGMTDPFCRGTYPWQGGDTELHSAVCSIIKERNASPVLRDGSLTVRAADGDTLSYTRELDGKTLSCTFRRDI